jgi:hypothetical protein
VQGFANQRDFLGITANSQGYAIAGSECCQHGKKSLSYQRNRGRGIEKRLHDRRHSEHVHFYDDCNGLWERLKLLKHNSGFLCFCRAKHLQMA